MLIVLGLGDADGFLEIVVRKSGVDDFVTVLIEVRWFVTARNGVPAVEEEDSHTFTSFAAVRRLFLPNRNSLQGSRRESFQMTCPLVRLVEDEQRLTGSQLNKLRDYLRISEAAEYLGVSPNTLRNWENAGKVTAHRHPVNGYRLFKQQDLDALLKQVERPKRKSSTK